MTRGAQSQRRLSRLALRLSFLAGFAALPGSVLGVHAYGANWPAGIIMGALGATAVPLLVVWLAVQRLVTRPLGLVLHVVNRLAVGDFSSRTRPWYGDELGSILRALDDLAGRLEATLAAARASERRYRLLFEHNPAGMFRTRADDGRILECNEAAVRMLGYGSVIEAKTYRADECYANPADRKALLERLRTHEVIASQEVRFRRKDGGEIPVLLSLCRVDEEGTTYLEGQFVDLSARKGPDVELVRAGRA